MNKSVLICVAIGILVGYYLSIKIGGFLGSYVKPLGSS